MEFDTGHEEVFRKLGAINPVQQWSAFDVDLANAREGKATRLVIMIWSDEIRDEHGEQKISAEEAIDEGGECGWSHRRRWSAEQRRNAKSHWNRLEIAWKQKLPVIGVLKDRETKRCFLGRVFECTLTLLPSKDGDVFKIRLVPKANVQSLISGRDHDGRDQSILIFGVTDEEILASSVLPQRDFQARLKAAPKLPERKEVTVTVFERNPDVVVWVLWRAAGRCEGCKKPAPFKRKKDVEPYLKPYLEVHHRKPLALGGEYTVENAVALCLNCHRRKHYGETK